MAALLGMLNSCASNVTVVNIDAGFKGGYVAGLIAKNAARGGELQIANCKLQIAQLSIAEVRGFGLDRRRISISDLQSAICIRNSQRCDAIAPSANRLPRLPPRPPDAHKGTFGTALIVGGSRGMTGAVALAGMAALRGGAGLVRLAVADRCLDTVAAFEPSYMTAPLARRYRRPDRRRGLRRDRASWRKRPRWSPAGRAWDGRRTWTSSSAGSTRRSAKPMVVDADGLNALADAARSCSPSLAARGSSRRIPASSPGWSARKAPCRTTRQAVGRRRLAARCANRCVVLKGHRTLVTDGRRHGDNTTGNPGMATGGSGDVLTGLITALACQGLEPFDAARLGVYLHGLAGDLAAAELGQVSLIASDLVRFLPKAFEQCQKGDSQRN